MCAAPQRRASCSSGPPYNRGLSIALEKSERSRVEWQPSPRPSFSQPTFRADVSRITSAHQSLSCLHATDAPEHKAGLRKMERKHQPSLRPRSGDWISTCWPFSFQPTEVRGESQRGKSCEGTIFDWHRLFFRPCSPAAGNAYSKEVLIMIATDEQFADMDVLWDLALLRRGWGWFVTLGAMLVLVGTIALAS